MQQPHQGNAPTETTIYVKYGHVHFDAIYFL